MTTPVPVTATIPLPELPALADDFWRDVLKIDGGELPFPESPVYPAGDRFLAVLAPSVWRDGYKLRVAAYAAIHSRDKGNCLADFEATSDWFDFGDTGLIRSTRNAFLESHSRLVQVIAEQGWTASWAEADTPTILLQVQESSDD